MGGTLYAALGMHSYILTIVCCGAQVTAVDDLTTWHKLSRGMPCGAKGVQDRLGWIQCALLCIACRWQWE